MNYRLEYSNPKPKFFSNTSNPSEGELDSKIIYEFEGGDLQSVIRHLECFLRGSGFVFSGDLGILEQDEKE